MSQSDPKLLVGKLDFRHLYDDDDSLYEALKYTHAFAEVGTQDQGSISRTD